MVLLLQILWKVVAGNATPVRPGHLTHACIIRAETFQRLDRIRRSESSDRHLDLEELRDRTGPPLRTTGATLLHVLCVLGGDDVLACLGVVHDGVGVREEAVEAPVEDAGGDERVDVADVEPIGGELLAWAPNTGAVRRELAANIFTR